MHTGCDSCTYREATYTVLSRLRSTIFVTVFVFGYLQDPLNNGKVCAYDVGHVKDRKRLKSA
jgi:hypothetical protein